MHSDAGEHRALAWRRWPYPACASPAPVTRARAPDGRPASDEVELYHRTYTTLLRSSGETLLRVLEPSHAAMNSSLHSLANALDEPDLGAFLYAMRRLPARSGARSVIVMGQEARSSTARGSARIEDWEAGRGARPPAAVVRLRARARSPCCWPPTSDLDDLIPTLVAYQVEWNKLHALLRAGALPEARPRGRARRPSAAREDDWRASSEDWRTGSRRSSTRCAGRG